MQNPSTMPGQPQLGTPIPGTTGGLPALSGLSVTQNPLARQLQSYGRGEDTMLVHMTPNEVNSLQGLAMAHGGSLTINPHTGLPEAGWLGKLLPTILGFAGAAFGLPTWALALGGTAAGTAATGNLGQGLMMGLQAYGGASLAGGLGVGEAGKKAAELAAKNAGTGVLNNAADTALTVTRTGAQQAAAAEAAIKGAQTAGSVATKAPGVFDKFTAFSKAGLPGGIIGKAAPYAAGMGLMSAVSDATQPNLPTYNPEENKFKYVSMAPAKREVRFQTPEQMRQSGGAEFQYITPNNPEPVPVSSLPLEEQKKYTYADGGMAKAPLGFEELVASYSAANPGAITASVYYPTSTPPAATEKNYFPTPSAANPAGPGAPPAGGYDGTLYGIGGINYGGIDLSGVDWSAISQNLGINNIQQQLQQQQQQLLEPTFNTIRGIEPDILRGPLAQSPDLSGIYGRLDELNSRVQSLPAQQPVYEAPDLSGVYDRFGDLEARLQQQPTYQAPDLSGIYDRFGALESKLESLPDQQPVYQAPDLSGIYDRFGDLEARLQQQPTYQAPDLSGIYDRFGALESKLQSLPDQQPVYQAPDLSGIYDRFGALESKLQSLPAQQPVYQAPDLSGIYDRFGAIESKLQALPTQQPTYQAPDLSGIYDRFGAIESKLQSLPTQQPVYQAPDLSGIYDRFGAIESKLQAMPTYQAPDLSGIYDRFGAIESKLQAIPTQQPTYQAPDLSGIYDRFGALESKLNSMPTYEAPDLSGLYDRLNQIESRFDYVPPNNFAGMEYIGDFAKGGNVNMRDGAFVVDARTVSELGNGSSNAGIELLSRMGGKPVRGPGDGVSDSVPAKIGGKQEARVARDEVIFQPDAVRRIGGGDAERGTQKLYALMNKAHKARKKAKRGQDTKLRKGLA